MATQDRAADIDTPQKLELFSKLMIDLMTPQEFREAIKLEAGFTEAGLMYDNLLRHWLRHSPAANLAERRAMARTKYWWFSEVDEKIKLAVKARYYGTVEKLTINTARSWPYGRNDYWTILYNGVPTWELPKILTIAYGPEASRVITEKINQQGGRGYYEVRFLPPTAGSINHGVSVKKITEEQWKANGQILSHSRLEVPPPREEPTRSQPRKEDPAGSAGEGQQIQK